MIPQFARMLGEPPQSLLDTLAYAERMGWLENAEEFFGARKMSNLLVHDYMTEPEQFLEAMKAAAKGTPRLMAVVAKIRDHATRMGLTPDSP